VHFVGKSDFVANAVDALAAAAVADRDVKAIAWRNKTVHLINSSVRARLYGDNPPPWVVGERVMSASSEGFEGNKMHTDQEGVIVAVSATAQPHPDVASRPDLDGLLVVNLRIRAEQLRGPGTGAAEGLAVGQQGTRVGECTAHCIHPDSAGELEARLRARRAQANELTYRLGQVHSPELHAAARAAWIQFWSLKGAFADIRYCHAITAHRSQGSTYAEVWVDGHDILANTMNKEEALKCLYVAVSRASHTVWFSCGRAPNRRLYRAAGGRVAARDPDRQARLVVATVAHNRRVYRAAGARAYW
jgi:hypothetical protein